MTRAEEIEEIISKLQHEFYEIQESNKVFWIVDFDSECGRTLIMEC